MSMIGIKISSSPSTMILGVNLPAYVFNRPEAFFFVTVNMTGKYSEAHKPANFRGPGVPALQRFRSSRMKGSKVR